MIINHNIAAMNTNRQLAMNNSNAAKSLEKLSSGFRINRAGDDAAGLAISEKMRGQIRGLNQASRNAEDGISLVQTAEGALNETESILQRMRELAVQAANDTNTADDRAEIQKEINQLTSEINRIGNTTEFNTMKLLDGSKAITSKSTVTGTVTSIVNGTGGEVTVKYAEGVTISDSADAWKSAIAGGIVIGSDASADEAIDWDAVNMSSDAATVTLTKTAAGDLQIDLAATESGGDVLAYQTVLTAETMTAAAADGVYTVSFHGVTFDLDLEAFANATANSNVKLDLQAAKGDAATTDVTGTYGLNNDFSAGAADFTSFTIDGTNTALVGIDSLKISFINGTDITVTGFAADGTTALLTDIITPSTAPANEGEAFTYSENGISFTFELVADTAGGVIDSFTTNNIKIADLVAKTESQDIITTEVVSDDSLKMQIGANTGQSMAIDIGDMRSVALGVSSADAGATKKVIDSMGDEKTAYFTEIANVTRGTDNDSIEYALDVSTADKAAAAVTVIDQSISAVSSERSKLGAFQNRLEHTINNLGTSAENLSAAESRIRDVNMADEYTNYSKLNILSQAATAMLAQANQMPQTVLQLLR